MKEIHVLRGGGAVPKTLDNGDQYDSLIQLHDPENQSVETYSYVNTDFTAGYKGGILAEGIYAGIKAMRDNGNPAIYLFNVNYIDQVKSKDDLTDKIIELPSLIKNPNHKNKKIITSVLIHKGGLTWDYSHGCITILETYFDKFIKNFDNNEKVKVILTRKNTWIAPPIYN